MSDFKTWYADMIRDAFGPREFVRPDEAGAVRVGPPKAVLDTPTGRVTVDMTREGDQWTVFCPADCRIVAMGYDYEVK